MAINLTSPKILTLDIRVIDNDSIYLSKLSDWFIIQTPSGDEDSPTSRILSRNSDDTDVLVEIAYSFYEKPSGTYQILLTDEVRDLFGNSITDRTLLEEVIYSPN